MLPPCLQYIYLSACRLHTLPKFWYIHVSRWVVFSLSQMQVNVQVQMQGGVGDSCIFRRIGIWNRLFFVLLLVWRMIFFFFFSLGIRCFSDIYKDIINRTFVVYMYPEEYCVGS